MLFAHVVSGWTIAGLLLVTACAMAITSPIGGLALYVACRAFNKCIGARPPTHSVPSVLQGSAQGNYQPPRSTRRVGVPEPSGGKAVGIALVSGFLHVVILWGIVLTNEALGRSMDLPTILTVSLGLAFVANTCLLSGILPTSLAKGFMISPLISVLNLLIVIVMTALGP
jgi:hypothetical protein